MTGSDCSGKTEMEAEPARHIAGSLDVIPVAKGSS